MDSGGVITRQLLKTRSGEFDVESIHTLVLHKLNISNLGCIGECTVLERLDLSFNDINRLYSLAGLTNLLYLNLSANRISSLEGLQSLDSIQVLNLAGNLIGSLDVLHVLSQLDKLEELRLRDPVRMLSNPVCMNNTYKANVISILPRLKILDGEQLSGRGSELYKMCEDIDKMIEDQDRIKDMDVSTSDQQGEWVPTGFWENKASQEFDGSSLGDAQQQLEALLADCHRVTSHADELIKTTLPPS